MLNPPSIGKSIISNTRISNVENVDLELISNIVECVWGLGGVGGSGYVLGGVRGTGRGGVWRDLVHDYGDAVSSDVNFTNVLHTAFTLIDPESVKRD
jgi:hypothetical protein